LRESNHLEQAKPIPAMSEYQIADCKVLSALVFKDRFSVRPGAARFWPAAKS
jgi:hypothetical protein